MERLPHVDLHSVWDKIDTPKKKHGDVWAEQYLDTLIDELVFLKQKARRENNPYLYNQLRTSLIRAHEVKAEINEKIKT